MWTLDALNAFRNSLKKKQTKHGALHFLKAPPCCRRRSSAEGRLITCGATTIDLAHRWWRGGKNSWHFLTRPSPGFFFQIYQAINDVANLLLESWMMKPFMQFAPSLSKWLFVYGPGHWAFDRPNSLLNFNSFPNERKTRMHTLVTRMSREQGALDVHVPVVVVCATSLHFYRFLKTEGKMLSRILTNSTLMSDPNSGEFNIFSRGVCGRGLGSLGKKKIILISICERCWHLILNIKKVKWIQCELAKHFQNKVERLRLDKYFRFC